MYCIRQYALPKSQKSDLLHITHWNSWLALVKFRFRDPPVPTTTLIAYHRQPIRTSPTVSIGSRHGIPYIGIPRNQKTPRSISESVPLLKRYRYGTSSSVCMKRRTRSRNCLSRASKNQASDDIQISFDWIKPWLSTRHRSQSRHKWGLPLKHGQNVIIFMVLWLSFDRNGFEILFWVIVVNSLNCNWFSCWQSRVRSASCLRCWFTC